MCHQVGSIFLPTCRSTAMGNMGKEERCRGSSGEAAFKRKGSKGRGLMMVQRWTIGGSGGRVQNGGFGVEEVRGCVWVLAAEGDLPHVLPCPCSPLSTSGILRAHRKVDGAPTGHPPKPRLLLRRNGSSSGKILRALEMEEINCLVFVHVEDFILTGESHVHLQRAFAAMESAALGPGPGRVGARSNTCPPLRRWRPRSTPPPSPSPASRKRESCLLSFISFHTFLSPPCTQPQPL